MDTPDQVAAPKCTAQELLARGVRQSTSPEGQVALENIADYTARTRTEWARILGVSEKTLIRYEQMEEQPLCGITIRHGRRMRAAYTTEAIHHFRQSHPGVLDRAQRFSRMSQQEKEEIIAEGKRLANARCADRAMKEQIAQITGRSVEAIRYTIHDTEEQRARLQRIVALPIHYMPQSGFAAVSKWTERKIVAPPPPSNKPEKTVHPPKGLPPYLAALYHMPLLTREQEEHMFRQMNYYKYKAVQLRAKLVRKRIQKKHLLMDQIESFHTRALHIRNQLIEANLRLVVSIAREHMDPHHHFFELVSDGNEFLIQAVDQFDYTRGLKFSTYASWVIRKNLPRAIARKDRRLACPSDSTLLEQNMTQDRLDPHADIDGRSHHTQRIATLLRRLDERERNIIYARFALRRTAEPQTLQQIGEREGVTKERIRQLEARALTRMRQYAEELGIDFDEHVA